MRLIDADALKEKLKPCEADAEVCENSCEGCQFRVVTAEEIDNAPTVIPDNDIFEWCTDCKEYDQEKHCCHRWSSKIREAAEEVKQYKLDELRPHGEWITTRTMTHDGNPYCTVCDEENIIRSKFCPNCGADMRKGGAE